MTVTESRISPMLPKHPKSVRAPAGAKQQSPVDVNGDVPVLTAASLALGGSCFRCKEGTWAGRGEQGTYFILRS